jgi:hypothetical protein
MLFRLLRPNVDFQTQYELVYQNDYYEIYCKRDSLPSAAVLSGGF